MTQTNYFGHGVPRKVARLCGERRHNGAGEFWDILSQSSIAEFVLTSPKAGFGEVLPTSVFAARRDAKIASVATLALLAVSASTGTPTEKRRQRRFLRSLRFSGFLYSLCGGFHDRKFILVHCV